MNKDIKHSIGSSYARTRTIFLLYFQFDLYKKLVVLYHFISDGKRGKVMGLSVTNVEMSRENMDGSELKWRYEEKRITVMKIIFLENLAFFWD